jgi:hypothetical protein
MTSESPCILGRYSCGNGTFVPYGIGRIAQAKRQNLGGFTNRDTLF